MQIRDLLRIGKETTDAIDHVVNEIDVVFIQKKALLQENLASLSERLTESEVASIQGMINLIDAIIALRNPPPEE